MDFVFEFIESAPLVLITCLIFSNISFYGPRMREWMGVASSIDLKLPFNAAIEFGDTSIWDVRTFTGLNKFERFD